jgi:hypothetical protein
MRDIASDAFEFLYAARDVISGNRLSVAFPLLRRAFESVSLCSLFAAKPEYASLWASGKQFSNADVRKILEHHPTIESIEEVREVYKHFSQGTHSNRTHIPYLFLGEGNQFTLGAIPPVDPYGIGLHVRHLIYLCYWYVGVFLWFYRELLPKTFGGDFAREFLDLTPRRAAVRLVLDLQLERMEEQMQKEPLPEGIGPAHAAANKSKRPE